MDRKFKPVDRIHVYATAADVGGKLVAVFEDQPYSRLGMDYYEYKNVMYPGYVYPTNKEVAYIILDQPLFKQ